MNAYWTLYFMNNTTVCPMWAVYLLSGLLIALLATVVWAIIVSL